MTPEISWREYAAQGIPAAFLAPKVPRVEVQARVEPPKPVYGAMNKLEASYAAHLELRKRAGEITKWRFEPWKLRLAPSTYYSPDFEILHLDGHIELAETKGFWREDGRVKIKVAAAMFDEFEFTGVTWSKKEGWKFERFRSGL